MAQDFDMSTYYARKLIQTPNNTTTFLRGDNTFSNILTDTLFLTAAKTVNLLGSSILTLGTDASTNLGLDSTSIQGRNNGSTSVLQLNPLGGQVQVGNGGLLVRGNINIVNSEQARSIMLNTPAGILNMYSGGTNGNRGIEIVTNGTSKTVFYADSQQDIYFNGTLIGNASTASAWAAAREVYVDLTSNAIASLNAGSTRLAIGISGTLPIASGGTNATTENGALKNLITGVPVANDTLTDATIFVSTQGDGDTDVWKRRSALSIWNYISNKIGPIDIENGFILKGFLSSLGSGTDLTDVPTAGYKVGWSYIVKTDGTYAGETCYENDLVVCVVDGADTGSVVVPNHWRVIHSTEKTYPLNQISGATDLQAIEALTGSNGLLRKENGSWTLDTTNYATSAANLNGALLTSLFTDGYQLLYSTAAETPAALMPNTTSAKRFLSMTGTGSAGAAPQWSEVTKLDVGLSNVEDVALSTWVGSSNITTIGTITTGTVPWANIGNKPSITIAGQIVSTDAGELTAVTLRQALGLSSALRFVGVATVPISDGASNDPEISGYNFSEAAIGDVILDNDSFFEYLWTGVRWEKIGGDSSYKILQSPVSSGNAATNAWIASLSQDSNGNITLTTGSLDTTGTWSGNATTATSFDDPQTVYVNLALGSTITTITGGSQNAEILGVDGILPTANGGTGVSTHLANTIVWATSATTLQGSGNHYINSTKIAVNSYLEPDTNFFVNGSSNFSASSMGVDDEWFTLGGLNTIHLSFGSNGIQAYSGNTASGLVIQPLDGTLTIGSSTDDTLVATYYGSHTFTKSDGFRYSGIQSFITNASYFLWFSRDNQLTSGIPGYNEKLTYNPYTGFLTINNGGIQSTGSSALSINSASDLSLNSSSSIIFGQIGNSNTTEMARFNSSRKLIVGAPQSPDNITGYQLYVDGATQIKGNLVPESDSTYSLGSSSLTWSALYIGSDSSYGSNTNPIYWLNGVPTPLSYTAHRLYYSSAVDSFSATSHYADTSKIAINSTSEPNENLYVNGTVQIMDVTTINENTDSSDYATGALVVTGGVGIGLNLNVNGKVGIGDDADGTHDLLVNGSTELLGNVGIGAAAQTGATAKTLYVDGSALIDETLDVGGVLHITDTTEATNASGALKVDGGARITLKLNVGSDTSIGGNLVVTGTSKLTDKVGIGMDVNQLYQLAVTGDTYIYGTTTSKGNILPQATRTYNLGSDSLLWNDVYERALSVRFIDAAPATWMSDSELRIGEGNLAATKKIRLYYSSSTGGGTEYLQINSNGAYALSYFGVGGQNTNYAFYVTGTSYLNGNITHNGSVYFANGTTYYINNSGHAELNNITGAGNLSITGTSTLTGRVGIGDDPNSSYMLYVNGAVGFNSSLTLSGQLYVNYEQDAGGSNTNGSVIIGDKTSYNLALDSDEIMARVGSSTSPLYINNDGGIVYIGSGGISNAGGIALTTLGSNISFAATGETGTSGAIQWSGSNDSASIFYKVTTAGEGRLIIRTDDNDCLIALNSEGTNKAYFDNSVPSFYPATTSNGTIGTTTNRWGEGFFSTNIWLGGTTYTTDTSAFAGTCFAPGTIDLSATSPYIDFHYNRSTEDYTARITADSNARLHIGYIGTATNITYNYRTRAFNLYNEGSFYSSGDIETAGHIMTNTDAAGSGFYLYGENASYGRMYIGDMGAAGEQGQAYLVLGNTAATSAANNAQGIIRLYGEGINYTDIYSQPNGNRNFYLPNYDNNMYAVHVGDNTAVGNTTTPVYIATNGRATVLSANVGNAYTPVYLNNGSITVASAVQKASFIISNAGTTSVITKTGIYTENTMVIAIVVETGESNLNGKIEWTSASNTVTLTTAQTSGEVTGYILTASGAVI